MSGLTSYSEPTIYKLRHLIRLLLIGNINRIFFSSLGFCLATRNRNRYNFCEAKFPLRARVKSRLIVATPSTHNVLAMNNELKIIPDCLENDYQIDVISLLIFPFNSSSRLN